MAGNRKPLARKVGLPPGTMLYVGDTRSEQVHIHVIEYSADQVKDYPIHTVKDLESIKNSDSGLIKWIKVDGLSNVKMIEQIGQVFCIHPLVLEDIVNTNQRPKLEDYGDYLYVVLQSLTGVTAQGVLQSAQISLILGKDLLISFQETGPEQPDIFNSIKERIDGGRGRLRRFGPDYLLYALMDTVVDHYYVVLEHIGDNIEEMEEIIVNSPGPELLRRIYDLKHEMLTIRRAVWPLREVIGSLDREEAALIQDSTHIYMRDVYDHTIQVLETVEIYRDMLSGMLDIYLSSISNRMSEIMKMLTIISTIFIPLTFIAGVYGMNFVNMPELQWEYGYYLVWVVMLGISLYMIRYFYRRGWL
ncbi:MAG TPA: magnesium/cobalt transporter CorA [Methylomusa anaerophila]|uniref:Magnesium transport protein CorA n=1 Tax=Methylomusa anaerophila TaxID=1930071 RepID=A0A348AGZ3_9FIRM|nr:magnesium/cobalt transporter CorA [Methylomusa anaerophila]BBB90341.1 magnesium transport protein CorA [Methylomusa anaerophila]HML89313.1 magnesium/cobalt transporter CorA [Methylomusa anaerophila]